MGQFLRCNRMCSNSEKPCLRHLVGFAAGISVDNLHINAVFFKSGGDAKKSQGRLQVKNCGYIFLTLDDVASIWVKEDIFHLYSPLGNACPGLISSSVDASSL